MLHQSEVLRDAGSRMLLHRARGCSNRSVIIVVFLLEVARGLREVSKRYPWMPDASDVRGRRRLRQEFGTLVVGDSIVPRLHVDLPPSLSSALLVSIDGGISGLFEPLIRNHLEATLCAKGG